MMSVIIALRLPPEIPAGTSFVLIALFLGLAPVAFSPGSPNWHQPNGSAPSLASSALAAGSEASSLPSSWEPRTTRLRTATQSDSCC